MSEPYPELVGLDFAAIAAYVEGRGWKWACFNRPPTADEIETEARRLVRDCADDEWHAQRGANKTGPRYKSLATGGLTVILYEDGSSVVNFGDSRVRFEVRRPPAPVPPETTP